MVCIFWHQNCDVKGRVKFSLQGFIMKFTRTLSCVSALFITLTVNAGLIDFETTALGLLPSDNGTIEFTDDFIVDGVTVRFGFDLNSDGILDSKAVYEEAGNTDAGTDTGFWGIGGAKDIAAPGYTNLLGNFFLRQEASYMPFGIFTILYYADNPVTGASGEIWDIDGGNSTEQFLIQAYDGSTLLHSISSPMGQDNTLNGKPWAFGFNGLSNITKINITFTGSKTTGIGLAFNNFSPVEDISESVNISEPSILGIFSLSLICLASRRFNKKY